MRIVAWNILDGGVGRADPIAEVLLAQRADVVIAIEADDDAVVDRLSRRLNMTALRFEGPGKHAAAVLTRHRLVEAINHAILINEDAPRSFVEVVVRDEAHHVHRISAVHLSARASMDAERQRMKEIGKVLEALSAHRESNTPHWIVGDLNSNSPHQAFDPANAHPRTRDEYAANGGQLPRDVIALLEQHGYLDSLRTVRQEAASTMMSFTTRDPGQRVDYALSWGVPTNEIVDAWVEHDDLARFASDHFPVGVEIKAAG